MEEKSEEPGYIIIKVMGEDNAVMHFGIKMHTPLRKMMNVYCDRAGLNVSTIRFRFDGDPINEHDTVLSTGLEEGDIIEAYQAQTEKVEEKSEEPGYIIIKVMDQDNAVMHFKIKRHTPLRKMMNVYCDRAGLNVARVSFRFDGEPINEHDTVLSKGMEEGDTIEAYQAQTEKMDETSEEPGYIIKVMGEDNAVMHFKIKRHTPLRKMMIVYCARAGLNVARVSFQFDGQPIYEHDTVLSTGLEEGDIIDAFPWRWFTTMTLVIQSKVYGG